MTMRVGTFAGISVRTHRSLLIVLGVTAWTLAASALPQDYPGYHRVAYGLAGIAGALGVGLALGVHEIGHALVARRQGSDVEGITLRLLGGVTRVKDEPTTPGPALRRAAATAKLVAAGLAGLALVVGGTGAPAIVEGVTRWLALVNVVVAGVNLIPAAPLDGGRLLQAALWWRSGDAAAAALAAARAGRAFGFSLIGIGLGVLLAGRGLASLCFVVLGWALLLGARAEWASSEAQRRLHGVRVAEVMTPSPVVAPGWVTVDAFLREQAIRHQFSSFPVERFDGTLDGLVTLKRLRDVPLQQRPGMRLLDVARRMEEVPVASSTSLLLDIAPKMSASGDGRALVIDDGRLVGIVTPTDVARALVAAHPVPRPPGSRRQRPAGA